MRWLHLLPLTTKNKEKTTGSRKDGLRPAKVFPQLGDPRTFVNEFTIILTLYQHGL